MFPSRAVLVVSRMLGGRHSSSTGDMPESLCELYSKLLEDGYVRGHIWGVL